MIRGGIYIIHWTNASDELFLVKRPSYQGVLDTLELMVIDGTPTLRWCASWIGDYGHPTGTGDDLPIPEEVLKRMTADSLMDWISGQSFMDDTDLSVLKTDAKVIAWCKAHRLKQSRKEKRRQLREKEKARIRQEEDARKRQEEEARKRQQEEARKRQEEEVRKRQQEEVRRRQAEEARKHREEEASQPSVYKAVINTHTRRRQNKLRDRQLFLDGSGKVWDVDFTLKIGATDSFTYYVDWRDGSFGRYTRSASGLMEHQPVDMKTLQSELPQEYRGITENNWMKYLSESDREKLIHLKGCSDYIDDLFFQDGLQDIRRIVLPDISDFYFYFPNLGMQYYIRSLSYDWRVFCEKGHQFWENLVSDRELDPESFFIEDRILGFFHEAKSHEPRESEYAYDKSVTRSEAAYLFQDFQKAAEIVSRYAAGADCSEKKHGTLGPGSFGFRDDNGWHICESSNFSPEDAFYLRKMQERVFEVMMYPLISERMGKEILKQIASRLKPIPEPDNVETEATEVKSFTNADNHLGRRDTVVKYAKIRVLTADAGKRCYIQVRNAWTWFPNSPFEGGAGDFTSNTWLEAPPILANLPKTMILQIIECIYVLPYEIS